MQNFKKLRVWRGGMDLYGLCFRFTKTLPLDERFRLSSQMRRSSMSISCNVAEGAGRRTQREFVRFLRYAISSSFELETQSLMCQQNGIGDPDQLRVLLARNSDVQRMLHGLIVSVEGDVRRET